MVSLREEVQSFEIKKRIFFDFYKNRCASTTLQRTNEYVSRIMCGFVTAVAVVLVGCGIVYSITIAVVREVVVTAVTLVMGEDY